MSEGATDEVGIKLGSKVTDYITGYTGTVTEILHSLDGHESKRTNVLVERIYDKIQKEWFVIGRLHFAIEENPTPQD